MMDQAPFSGRANFGQFLNDRKLLGKAVEVGTGAGLFADELLRVWQGQQLIGIDPYQQGYDPTDYTANSDMAEAKREALKQVRLWRGRYELRIGASPPAAAIFLNDSLDFAYVDANHQTESVIRDLEAWWPKVRAGGVLGGHDFVSPGDPDGGWGRTVQPAVLRFAERVDRTVFLVIELTCRPWSYYFVK